MAKPQIPAPIAQLKDLKPINSKLASHCDAYTIRGSYIFMHSQIPFLEKVAFVKDPEKISCFNRVMFNVLEMRSFMSSYRKTKSELRINDKEMRFSDKEKGLEATAHLLPSIAEDELISPVERKFYRKIGIDKLITTEIFIEEDHCFRALGSDEMDALQGGHVVETKSPDGVSLYLSKSIFGDIKTTSAIRIYDSGAHARDPRIRYVLFEQDEECGITIVTLAAAMQV